MVSVENYYPDTLFNVVVVDSPMTYLTIQLEPLPRTKITGKVLLSDTLDFSEVLVNAANKFTWININGYFELNELPPASLRVNLSKLGYVPTHVMVSIPPGGSLFIEQTLYRPIAKVLVINDAQSFVPVKSELIKDFVVKDYVFDTSNSAELFQATLEAAHYQVIRELSDETDFGTWDSYDFLVWSASKAAVPLAEVLLQSALIDYVNNGGKLIIEGGEIGHQLMGNLDFASTVLHIREWLNDRAGNLRRVDSLHPITQNLPPGITLIFSSQEDQDAVLPAEDDAHLLFTNEKAPVSAEILVAYSVIYLAFNIGAIKPMDAELLIKNMAWYMVRPKRNAYDLAILDVVGVQNGDLLRSDSTHHFGVIIKNLGTETYQPGATVALEIRLGDFV